MSIVYKLIQLINLNKKLQLDVLLIRNDEFIRKWMLSEDIISIESHFLWIETLKTDKNQIHYAIIDNNNNIFGVVNLKNINMHNKTAELGFYKKQNNFNKGLMTKCLINFIDYAFNVLNLEKIYTEVLEGNDKSINIHHKLQFIEEGYLDSHIVKDGIRKGLHLFGLSSYSWKEFNVTLNYKCNENEIVIL